MTRMTEFDGVFVEGSPHPVMTKPHPPLATREFEREVRDALGIPDERSREAADWVAAKMDGFAAYHARPVFTMTGEGPICSYCGAIWPLCGHHLMSGVDDEPEEEA